MYSQAAPFILLEICGIEGRSIEINEFAEVDCAITSSDSGGFCDPVCRCGRQQIHNTGYHRYPSPPRQNSCRFTDSNALLRRFAKVGQDKDIFSALGHLGKRSLVPIQLTAEFVEIRTVRIDSPIKLNERYSLVPPSEVVTCMLK